MINEIATFGDSHSKPGFGWYAASQKLGLMFDHKWMGPKLLNTLINSPPPEFVFAHRPRVNRALFLCAGEIDIRCHSVKVATEQGISLEDYGSSLADRTFSWLQTLEVPAQLCVYVPPPPVDEDKNHWNYKLHGVKNWVEYGELKNRIAAGTADEHSMVGPPDLRRRAHSAYRDKIHSACKNSDILVMDITEKIANDEGYLDTTLGVGVHDNCHVVTPDFFLEWVQNNLPI